MTLPTAPAIHRVYEIALEDGELAGLDWGARPKSCAATCTAHPRRNADRRTILVVGATSGIGLELRARDIVARGDRVVITGRDRARTEEVAVDQQRAGAIALDISEPEAIAEHLAPPARCTGSSSPPSSVMPTPCATTTSPAPDDWSRSS